MNVVGALKRKAEGLEEAAQLAATTGLDHWQKATTSLDTFGFTVGRFTVAMGVVPEIPTSISGSIANIREDGLKQIIAAHAGETLLVTMLEALDCRQAPLEAAATTPDRRSISPRSPSSCIGCHDGARPS